MISHNHAACPPPSAVHPRHTVVCLHLSRPQEAGMEKLWGRSCCVRNGRVRGTVAGIICLLGEQRCLDGVAAWVQDAINLLGGGSGSL